MELLSKQLPASHKLYLAGDFHEGSLLQHEEGIEQMVDIVGSGKNSYVVFMGDSIEAIHVDHPYYRLDFDTQDKTKNTPVKQALSIAKKLKPIKNNIITILDGNHEWFVHHIVDINRDILCKELGNSKPIPHGGWSCKLSIKDKRDNLVYKAFLTHGGRGSIRSNAADPLRREVNEKLQVKDKLKNKSADTVIQACGHYHRLIIVKPKTELYLTDDGEKIRQHYTSFGSEDIYIHPDLRWQLCTGSFMKLYVEGETGYAERWGLDPVELGFIEIQVEDKKIIDIKKIIL